MIIGCHVSMTAPEYLEGSVKEALSYHANALMLYTGAPQNTLRKPVSSLHHKEAQALMKANGIPMDRMIVHAPYLINPANSVKKEVAELAGTFLQNELNRTAEIGAKYLVLHPGAYTSTDLETGIQTTVKTLNGVHNLPDGVTICLETMSGKGSEIGFEFEQLAEILSHLNQAEHFGICLDTCHINDAGMDVGNFDQILDQFDHLIGIERLHVIHLNDSKNEKGSHKDRHANLGMGTIGFEKLHAIAVNPRIDNVIKILETPWINEQAPYSDEISMLKSNLYCPNWTAKYEKEEV
ncbi:MAG: deoxyribonuclease IV [Erysipelotrichia bacterium]|nr:deoxyribonuclease IV [Erysipelotrichia bacterium]